MKKQYDWKLKSFAKGIDPNKAAKELKRIESIFGELTPEHILEMSSNESDLFHPLFTWDNDRAANMFRLSQARTLLNNIEIVIISDGQPRLIPVYEVINLGDGRIYKQVSNMSTTDIEEVKKRTLTELNYLKNKLSIYEQLKPVVDKINEAIELI